MGSGDPIGVGGEVTFRCPDTSDRPCEKSVVELRTPPSPEVPQCQWFVFRDNRGNRQSLDQAYCQLQNGILRLWQNLHVTAKQNEALGLANPGVNYLDNFGKVDQFNKDLRKFLPSLKLSYAEAKDLRFDLIYSPGKGFESYHSNRKYSDDQQMVSVRLAGLAPVAKGAIVDEVEVVVGSSKAVFTDDIDNDSPPDESRLVLHYEKGSPELYGLKSFIGKVGRFLGKHYSLRVTLDPNRGVITN